jgi:hypothetical protein
MSRALTGGFSPRRRTVRRGLASAAHFTHDHWNVVVVLFLRDAPGAFPILVLTLAVAMYLTVIELRELNPHWKWWAWWLSFVFFTHFLGYLTLRVYVAYRRRNRARV